MKFILKEYGSWGVIILSFLTGVLVSRNLTIGSFVSFLSLCLFINSKQAFTVWIRQKDQGAPYIFAGQIISGILLILIAFSYDSLRLIPFALIPVVYIASLYVLGEHALLTEMFGFATLTISSLIARFSVTGLIDMPLYVATALFFMASVWKIRIQLRKKGIDRVLMLFYLLIAFSVYSLLNLPAIMLFPLIDNLIFAITLYRARLKTAGWIEVTKGIFFVVISTFYYQS